MAYIIFSYQVACDKEDLIKNGGWFETDYLPFMAEDIADVKGYFDSEAEAYKAWDRHYSGTEFFFEDTYDTWDCIFYVLCKRVDGTEDETEIVQTSCGCLLPEDIEKEIIK